MALSALYCSVELGVQRHSGLMQTIQQNHDKSSRLLYSRNLVWDCALCNLGYRHR